MVNRRSTLCGLPFVLVLVLVLVLGSSGCADSRPEPFEAGEAGQSAEAGQSGRAGQSGSANTPSPAGNGTIAVGCREQPLVLGAAADHEFVAPQLVWTGDEFAVGWTGPDSYELRITDGRSISNSAHLPAPPSTRGPYQPQLFWARGRLELYYALSEAVFVDTLDAALNGIETRMLGSASMFRAVQMNADQIAVLADSYLYVDGGQHRKQYSYVNAVGWNGEYFSVSGVTGHGQWSLDAFDLNGARLTGADFGLQWCGVCGGTGLGGGSFYASSPSARRHAVVVAASSKLEIAVEGMPALERELAGEDADASLLWDGERYVALLADHETAPPGDAAAANRDIELLPVTLDARHELRAHPTIAISRDPADERFPVAAAAGVGDYAIAWLRGSELVVQRCALSQR